MCKPSTDPMTDGQVANLAGSSPRFTILKSLPGYRYVPSCVSRALLPIIYTFSITASSVSHSLGDTLRDDDAALCKHREATKLAWKECSEGDYVFIKRSGGTLTYARCEGYDADEPTALSFAVDNKGHFKVVGESRWSKLIRVPAVENGASKRRSTGVSCATPLSSEGKVHSDADILRLARAKSAGDLRQRMNEMANPNRATAVDRSGLMRRGSMPALNGLSPVAESSKAARQMSAEVNLFSRRDSSPSLNGLKRSSSKGGTGRSRGNLSGQMYPTMESIQETSTSTPPVNANASWDLMKGTARPSENPLLRMMAEREKANSAPPAENPLLKMIDDRIKKKSEARGEVEGHPKTRRKWALGTKCTLSKKDIRQMIAADITMTSLASNLKVNEGAFIRRSDGTYRYAILSGKTTSTMTFEVTETGKTKKVDVVSAGKDVIPEQIVIAKGGGAVHDNSDGAAGTVEQGMKPSTSSSNSLATMQRRRSSNLLSRRGGSREGLQRTVSELSGRTVPRNTMGEKNSSFDLIRPSSEPDRLLTSAMKKTTRFQPKKAQHDRKDKVKFVSCRTEDGKTQVLPIYSEGLDVFYKTGKVITAAKILKAHQDDLLVPYYTIKISIPHGKEKQTTGSHIFLTKAEALQEDVSVDSVEDDEDDTAASATEKDAVFDDAEVKKFDLKWC